MNEKRRKIKLLLHYDGSGYHGWAAQPGMATIQGTLQEAFYKLCGQAVTVVGSSRTDAGVHALGQTAHVVLNDCPVPTENLQKALNRLLPAEIVIADLQEVEDSFHAISSTVSKVYCYTICTDPLRPVFDIRRCWHYPVNLDSGAMQQAAQRLIGTRDFTSFAAAADQRQSSIRTILRCQVLSDPPWIRFEVEADGFLYNMVRNIVGTLTEIGRGRWNPEKIDEILEARDRAAAGPIAPPQGLCLVKIHY
jgi:tRNA pseudouridine38-40 synthase